MGELLGEIALAVQHHFTIADIIDTIHIYPTLSTGIQQAAFTAYLESTATANNRKIARTMLNLRG